MENQTGREKEDGDYDRISGLPDSVLHRILCFLSQKKAVQTCVLSKSWRHLGPTRPVIDLRGACANNDLGHVRGINDVCENCFDENKKAFTSVVVDNTFQRYYNHNLFPQELHLEMSDVVDSESISVLEKWIPIIFIKPNVCVNAFHISFGQYWTNFDLPSVVFKVESLRELHLKGCRLNDDIISIDNLMLKNLQKLSLSKVVISDEALEKVLSSCPLVKSVVDNCPGLETIKTGNKEGYLNYFAISCFYGDSKNNNYFPNYLKSLLLSHVTLSTKSFHYFSCNFPRLQELSLLYCSGFEEINLSSRSIKRLIIHDNESWSWSVVIQKIAIEVPNILYFELSINHLQKTLSLAPTSREWKSHINLHRCLHGYANNFLPRIVRALSQSQISLTLFETLYSNINQIAWDFKDQPVALEHLGLRISNFSPDTLTHFLNALFSIFRPRYTNVVRVQFNDDEEATKFLWKKLINERGKAERGWEQHLEEVSIEASDEEGKVWHHVQWACLPRWSKNQKIRFRLKWRD